MITAARDAARLVYLAIQTGMSPLNNVEYRNLLIRFRAEPDFEGLAKGISRGMELEILDVSERGLVIVPANKESRFAVRLTDLRQQMSGEQRVVLAITYLTIAAVFFPTNDRLEDEAFVSPGERTRVFRETLSTLVKSLANDESDDLAVTDLEPGWMYLHRMPVSARNGERASMSSLDGCVKLALKQLQEYGMVRATKPAADEDDVLYTPTYRFRVHLRELTERVVFDFICKQIQAETAR